MASNSDFDEIFGDLDYFNETLTKKFQVELKNILEKIERANIKGLLKISKIDNPDEKGYLIQGNLDPIRSLEPIEPLKPFRRRPRPDKLFEPPNMHIEQPDKPLVDVIEEKNAIKVYVEMKGKKQDEIKVNLNKGNIEIRGKNFNQIVKLPKKHFAFKKVASEYKNGILVVTIKKKEEPSSRYADRERMV